MECGRRRASFFREAGVAVSALAASLFASAAAVLMDPVGPPPQMHRDAVAFSMLDSNRDVLAVALSPAAAYLGGSPEAVVALDAWCDTVAMGLVGSLVYVLAAVSGKIPRLRRVCVEWVVAALLCAVLGWATRLPQTEDRVSRARDSGLLFAADPAQGGARGLSFSLVLVVIAARRLVHITRPSAVATVAVWIASAGVVATHLVTRRGTMRDVAPAVFIGLWVTSRRLLGPADLSVIDEACKASDDDVPWSDSVSLDSAVASRLAQRFDSGAFYEPRDGRAVQGAHFEFELDSIASDGTAPSDWNYGSPADELP